MAEEQGPWLRGGFELALREFAEKAGDRADAAVREVVLEVWSRVIARSTPVVDTGRFRANWQYGIAEAPIGETISGGRDRAGRFAKTGTTEAPLPPPGAIAIEPGTGWGNIHYIVNNVPYARRLEYGHSAKGSKMVRQTIADFAGIVDGAAARVNQ